MKKYFTSESVTCGHPDKVCDQIADKILDEILLQDSNARVACEVTCTTNQVHIFGEVTTTAKVDYVAVTKEVINEIGYTAINRGFDATNCQIIVDLDEQSPDIALGVNRCYLSEELDNGAGDQGMMFGYACCQTQHYMPLPIELAHALAKRLELVRKTGELAYLLPDGKTQVTVEYENNQPLRISTVVVSSQHREDVDIATLREDITSHVILPTLPQDMLDHQTQIFINPTGRFVVGGPAGDSGLTGRKLIVDSYGGYARHGGGAFSGKDATKVDRSGAYMARYIAKNIVASGLAEECEVQLSYAIGLAQPFSLYIDTYQSEKVPQSEIYQTILNLVDLRPAAIIKRFQLNQPIYSKVACYGHFGNNASAMPWEQTDLVKPLQKLLNKR